MYCFINNMHGKILKKLHNKLKILAPISNDKFEFSDGSYPVLDIQDYFESKNFVKMINILLQMHLKLLQKH